METYAWDFMNIHNYFRFLYKFANNYQNLK